MPAAPFELAGDLTMQSCHYPARCVLTATYGVTAMRSARRHLSVNLSFRSGEDAWCAVVGIYNGRQMGVATIDTEISIDPINGPSLG
jgi:hypothetical protein